MANGLVQTTCGRAAPAPSRPSPRACLEPEEYVLGAASTGEVALDVADLTGRSGVLGIEDVAEDVYQGPLRGGTLLTSQSFLVLADDLVATGEELTEALALRPGELAPLHGLL